MSTTKTVKYNRIKQNKLYIGVKICDYVILTKTLVFSKYMAAAAVSGSYR